MFSNPRVFISPFGVKMVEFTDTFPIWQFPVEARHLPIGTQFIKKRITAPAYLFPALVHWAENNL